MDSLNRQRSIKVFKEGYTVHLSILSEIFEKRPATCKFTNYCEQDDPNLSLKASPINVPDLHKGYLKVKSSPVRSAHYNE